MKRIYGKITAFILIFVLTALQLSHASMGASSVSEKDSVLKSKIIVSMGDSFSSGEGIEKFYGQDDSSQEKVKNQDWLAHRSRKSWPGQLCLPSVSKTKSMSDYRNTNWYFVATSGAKTEHINGSFSKSYNYKGLSGEKNIDPQIDIFDDLGDKKADYITLTIGGNDAEFSEIIKCAGYAFFNPGAVSDKINNVWNEYYKDGGIRDKIRQAYSDISYRAGPQAKIIVAGYPKLIDKEGSGFLISKEEARIINTAVTNFNKEIETLVNSCKSDGMKICFVSVEEEFDGYEAYTDNACINSIETKPMDEDLDQENGPSAYSIHPNENGAKKYAKCVQEKIDEIEKDGGKSEWPLMSGSDERDAALVLDVSGSMSGTPLDETKDAAKRFVSTVLYEDAGIGIVAYDSSAMKLSEFNKNPAYLNEVIERLNSGGGTNIESGLKEAEDMLKMSNAKKKFIVLMSDGEPNEGKIGDSLIDYADSLKKQGIRIYTLGFFTSLSSSSKTNAQLLMEKIASDGCHFEVDDASQLMFFFEDIADQISGTKYQYIRIACPVDVTVKYDGETLSSEDAQATQRTSFGTLTFEENAAVEKDFDTEETPNETRNSSMTFSMGTSEEKTGNESDNRVKILRLKEGPEYKIEIDGNGKGKMTYTIGFMDEDGEYNDMRKFKNIPITKRTKIDTVASRTKTSVLKVDENGDGKYDHIYKASENGIGKPVEYSGKIIFLLSPVMLLALLLIILYTRKKIYKKLLNSQAS